MSCAHASSSSRQVRTRAPGHTVLREQMSQVARRSPSHADTHGRKNLHPTKKSDRSSLRSTSGHTNSDISTAQTGHEPDESHGFRASGSPKLGYGNHRRGPKSGASMTTEGHDHDHFHAFRKRSVSASELQQQDGAVAREGRCSATSRVAGTGPRGLEQRDTTQRPQPVADILRPDSTHCASPAPFGAA